MIVIADESPQDRKLRLATYDRAWERLHRIGFTGRRHGPAVQCLATTLPQYLLLAQRAGTADRDLMRQMVSRAAGAGAGR